MGKENFCYVIKASEKILIHSKTLKWMEKNSILVHCDVKPNWMRRKPECIWPVSGDVIRHMTNDRGHTHALTYVHTHPHGPTQSVGHRHSCICHPSSLLLLITSSLSLDAGFISIWLSVCPVSRLSQGLLWGHLIVWCNLHTGKSIRLTNRIFSHDCIFGQDFTEIFA